MQNIIITRPDGSLVPMQNKRTATKIKSAKQNISLLDIDLVNITIESPFKQEYGIGDSITIFGRIYKMNRLPKVKKTGNFGFSYDLEFEGIQYDLLRATYNLNIDTTNNQLQDVQADTLIGDLRRFATVLVSNANRVMPDKWRLGDCPDTIEDVNLVFGESDNCLSVLQMLCEQFGYEFEIEQSNAVYIIHFRKAGQTFPFTFEYGKGKGLYALDRQNVSSANIITRLNVFGSTKNITNKYRAQRLCLLGVPKAQSYIEKPEAVAKYGVWEATKYFEDVFPRRTGTVTALGDSVLKFVDNSMFDLNAKEADGVTTKYLLNGVSAKVHFNTGNLAGYDFDVHEYDHATKTFTLAKFTDERGDVFPSESSAAFQFGVGNEYKLLDVALPEEYEVEAENDLANKGETYYDQNCQPKVQYGLSITPSFLEKMVGSGTTGNIIMVGDYIPVKDDDIDVDKSVRVRAFSRDLLDEYSYTLTISDTVEKSVTNRVISELIDIDKIMTINNLKDPTQARANWRSSRELMNMVFDPEGDYYTEKIKPNSIDTLALSVGAKSMQFGLTNTVLQPNYNGNKNLIRVQGGVLTHYTIDEDSARSWILADNQTTLTGDTTPYYIYAKCQRSGDAGSIIFSPEQIKVEQDANFYHFWIGVVNSVDVELGVRSIALSYGFTMINGRFIKTGRIESADGTTYFDLDNSEIGGRIVFTSNGSEKTLEELGQESLESKDFINNTLPGILSEIQAQLDGQIEQFFETYDPTTSNAPANTWTTTADKENHLGDLFYNTATGKVWRWVKEGNTYKWQELQDSELAQALALANEALALAKDKNRIFTTTPTTPYEVGDLWVQGASGGIYRCKTTRLTGSYSSGDWELASKYTDDSGLNTFINGTYNTQINNLVTQIDGKIETWFQTSDPAASWTTIAVRDKHVGDMWYSSSTKLLKRYSKSGTAFSWTTIEDQKAIDAYAAASNAQDTADGKRRVFVATPYPPYDIGDLWVNGVDLRRCATKRTSGSYYANDWVIAVHYDNTKTTIDGGIVTSGTVQLAGSSGSILAGITGQGTAATSIRIWAGASFENRATAPFRVMQDGSVVMSKATVEGVIKAISGSIGGFEVASGRIGATASSTGTSGQGLSLYGDFIKFANSTNWASIGTNVLPSSVGYEGLARFVMDKSNDSYGTGIALYTKARFGNPDMYWYDEKRRSFYNDGNMFSIGGHALFDDRYIGQAYTDILEAAFSSTHQFIFTSISASLLTVRVPTKAQVTNKVGNIAVSFLVHITIPTGVSNKIRVTSQTGGQIYNNNGGAVSYIDMATGDILVLRYYNGGWYQISHRN
ncbi:phage tail protein [Bacteroides sp. 224]|uniref:phage tail protein n=1 Tax=Bacteroides sp. 224 TaxID=2302936 RepID=UPI0013D09604|nr:phage tail protein [Bacteroides sp. 224]NDV63779.1 hypothetical protein [Bacteroides sp. 224]